MKEIIDYLTKNMTAFQLWKIDKITDFKVWWFCRVTLKFKQKIGKILSQEDNEENQC